MTEPIRSKREFEFSRQDFEEVRRLIHAHAGIALSDAKEDMVYSRLARRVRATASPTFRAYLDRLKNGADAEWEAFVNSLTTNLTDFFREAHHFGLLRDFLASRRERPIVLWSCAASTGEEPYSMAMTAVEAFGGFTAPVRILASDLDTNVLQTARDGLYAAERLDKVSAERRRRFFLSDTSTAPGQLRVRPELRTMVEFFQLNLLAPLWPMRAGLDAIFCRNVMIYFDKATQLRILTRMKPLLKPDGLLFMGHSEALYHAGELFHLRGQTVYEHAPPGTAARPADGGGR